MQPPLAPPPWVADAVCPLYNPDTWFPAKGREDLHTRKIAKKICRGCPVVGECLDHAILQDERHGIWGGLTRNERIRVKQQRAAAGAR